MRTKKAFLVGIILVCLGLLTVHADAAWTLTTSQVAQAGHYLKWKVVCTSDGSSLAATDILPLMSKELRDKIKGETLMLMKIDPGTGSVIPNGTINITISDDEGEAIFADTGLSKDTFTWRATSKDLKAYIPVMGKLYLTVNDIGDAGDQVTLYFISWREDR